MHVVMYPQAKEQSRKQCCRVAIYFSDRDCAHSTSAIDIRPNLANVDVDSVVLQVVTDKRIGVIITVVPFVMAATISASGAESDNFSLRGTTVDCSCWAWQPCHWQEVFRASAFTPPSHCVKRQSRATTKHDSIAASDPHRHRLFLPVEASEQKHSRAAERNRQHRVVKRLLAVILVRRHR